MLDNFNSKLSKPFIGISPPPYTYVGRSILRGFINISFYFSSLFALCIACTDDSTLAESEVESMGEEAMGGSIVDMIPNPVDMLQDMAIPDQAILDMDIDAGLSCSDNRDCSIGYCEEGICVLECESPDECGGFQDCRLGLCTDRCFGPGTCFRGGVCFNGACIPPQCEVNEECAEGLLCRGQLCVLAKPCEGEEQCNSLERCIDGNCEVIPACGGDQNCADNEICQDGQCEIRETCDDGGACPEGEDCIAGRCVPGLCRGSIDCNEGEICEAGECIPLPTSGVEQVIILNRPRSLIVGQILELRAVALNENGQIISAEGFSWVVTPNERGAIDEFGTFTAGPQEGQAEVTAIWSQEENQEVVSEPLFLPILPLPEPVLEGWRIRVSDGFTGLAVRGAEVHVNNDVFTSDEQGYVTFSLPEDRDQINCTVMAVNYDIVTLIELSERSIHIPLKPLSDDSVIAGFTGEMDFSQVRGGGQIELGLAGGAFNDGISQITFFDLIGQLFFTEVDAGPISATIPLPGGLVARGSIPFVGDLVIKDEYAVIAQPGFQLGWSFGGKIAITTVLGLLEGERISIARVLGVLLPFFDQFEHGIQIIPELIGLNPVADVNDQDQDGNRRELIPDYDNFPRVDLTPDQTQGLRLAVNVPDTFEGEGDAITLVLTGVDMVDVGFVPLGLSATQDNGLIPMRMAPPYQGLQAGDYIVVALTARFNNRIPRDISGLTQRFTRLPEQIDLANAFMPPPDYSIWEPAFRRFTPVIPPEADLLRVSFRGGVGRWVIYLPTNATEPIRLPFPTNPQIPDLTVGLDVRFDAIDLEPGVTLNDLIIDGGQGDLLQLDRFTERFSRRVDNGR